MKTLLYVLVGGVVVVGGGYVVLQKMQAPESPVKEMQTSEETTTENSEADTQKAFRGTGTVASLMARGGSFQCTASLTVQNSSSQGTAYISGEKIRGDFTSRAGGMTIASHFIIADGYSYSWSDAAPQGFKVKVDGSSSSQSSQGVTTNADVSYDCTPWTVDQSKFTVPSGITFLEYGAQ